MTWVTKQYKADVARIADGISTEYIQRWNAGLKDQMNGDEDGPWPDDFSFQKEGKTAIPVVEKIVWLLGGL